MAQRDQNFVWTIFVDAELSKGVRVELGRILAPFAHRAVINSDRNTSRSLLEVAKERNLIDPAGFVLTGQIDDDDAWATDTVGTVRSRTASWLQDHGDKPGLALTFKDGLIWIMYEMLDVDQLQRNGRELKRASSLRPYSFPFTSISCFVCSHLTAGITAISRSHSKIPELAMSNGFEMEVISSQEPMWLYCRHKQAMSSIYRRQADAVELSLAELSARFGIDEATTMRYVANAEQYGYSRKLREFAGERKKVKLALEEVDRKLDAASPDESCFCELQREKLRLSEELVNLTENLVVNPENLLRK